jgi:hypothetical protein
MKFLRINKKWKWGKSIHFYNMNDIESFRYDVAPNCIDIKLKNRDFAFSEDFSDDFKFDVEDFQDFLCNCDRRLFVLYTDNFINEEPEDETPPSLSIHK